MVAVAVCFFLSGAAALILQVLWTRMIGHVFGATALAVSTILTVFMGGLALGSHLGGRWAPRLKRPLLVFAVLESAVGLYGLLVPTLLHAMPDWQRVLLPEGYGYWWYAIARFLIVAILLLLPTTAMGATLPVLAEGVVERSDEMASKVGTLYAANTFGAVLGAMLGGFYLIPTLGMATTVYVAAAVDLAVAIFVLLVFRFGGRGWLRVSTPATSEADAEGGPEIVQLEPFRPPSTADRRRALVAFALSGGAAMALEVLWTRSVGVVIGASTYSFTLILTTFLIGLAVGAAVMTRRIRRVSDPVKVLAYIQLAVGILALAGNLLVDRLPLFLHFVARSQDFTLEQLYLANFFIAAVVMLPATLALGAVMPLVVRILAPEGPVHAGAIVGRAYALNTLGAIVGSFVAGFVLLPVLGVERGVQLSALLSLLVGAGLLIDRPKPRGRAVATVAVGLLVVVLAPGWNVGAWTAGLFRMYLVHSVYADGWDPYGEVVYHRDGLATTVTVERQGEGFGVALKVNGKTDASDVGDMPTQVLSGLLPVLLHDEPKSVLVIGYGSGVTPGAVLQAPVESLYVAEIEARVYEASNLHFGHVNHRPDLDPRASLVVDDGRNFLRTRSGTYDIIISEPSNPWMTGAASLFTTDFFSIAKQRLRPQGIFLQWLQLYELSTDNVHTLVRTFHSVFPHLLIFSPDPSSNDMLLVGSDHPLKVRREGIERWLADEQMRAELAKGGFESANDLLGLLLIDDSRVDALIGEGPLNTDDNALIEFSAPKDLLTYSTADADLPFLTAFDGRRDRLLDTRFEGFGPPWTDVADRLVWSAQLEDARTFIDRARKAGELDVDRVERLTRYIDGDDTEPVVIADETTRSDVDYARVVKAMIDGDDEDALAIAMSISDFAERSLAHRFMYGFLLYRMDEVSYADDVLETVIADEEFVQAYPTSLFYAGRARMFRGEYREGLAILRRFDALRPNTEPSGEDLPAQAPPGE